MALEIPWTPYRFVPGSYHVMNRMARVVASGMTKEEAEFICRSANEHFLLVDALTAFVDRSNEEMMGEQEGNHVAIWESMHGVAIKALEDAARPCRIAGEER